MKSAKDVDDEDLVCGCVSHVAVCGQRLQGEVGECVILDTSRTSLRSQLPWKWEA